MKKEGFTLVELLAVIVILAIILAIAVPGISNIIKSSTKGAFESDAKMVLTQLEYEKLNNKDFDVKLTSIDDLPNYGISTNNYESVSVHIVSNGEYIVIVGKNKWAGFKACGTIHNMKIVESGDTNICYYAYNVSKNVNSPLLAKGMTPIKWNGTEWIDTTASDPEWYSYTTTDKKWANARTADGSMWVWIPRYVYKISSGWHSNVVGTIDIQFSKDIDDNWNSLAIGNIDTETSANSSNNKWTNHPAFTFGDTELTGIWVAKFEATAKEGVSNGFTSDGTCPTAGDNVTTKIVQVLPNVSSWRCISINNMFVEARGMETNSIYGWDTTGAGIDTHLMKNTEWGVVAYLSKSNYGQGTNEIWINNSQTYTTGCAGVAVSSGSYNGCQSAYDSANGLHASTTGNIYGIYDMSGGAWEYMSAYLNNANSNLIGQGSSIMNAASQYKNVYSVGSTDNQLTNYGLIINQKGDAVYEISNNVNGSDSWFGDYSFMLYTNYPWFRRGGKFSNGPGAGAFPFHVSNGGADNASGFRPVLAVSVTLVSILLETALMTVF